MPETSIAPPAPATRPAKPVSEALLNEKVCTSFPPTLQLLLGHVELAMAVPIGAG
jgi:hypothetical protein